MQLNDQPFGYQSQFGAPSYRRDDRTESPLYDPQVHQDRRRYQSQFQDNSSEPFGDARRGGNEMPRVDSEMRRGDSTYTNDLSRFQSDNTSIGVQPNRGGNAYRRHGQGGHISQAYDGSVNPSFAPGRENGNDADRAPQLNSYTPNPDMRSYGQTRSCRAQQNFGIPVLPPGVGIINDESLTAKGRPSSGCGHAGCNHNHN